MNKQPAPHHPHAAAPDAAFWSDPPESVIGVLEVDPALGLSESEAVARRQRYGPNQLPTARRRRLWQILLAQFRSIIVILLCVAALVALLFGDHVEGLAIIVVVLINTALGFFTEWRATRSMEALRELGRVDMMARRGGSTRRLAAEQLVPGDIVLVEGGDIVAADIRVLECADLRADESTLTGESVPVAKHSAAVPAATPLMERSNLLFKGTAVTRGTGMGVVVGTGQATELGQIARLVSAAGAHETPLERRLDALGRRLLWFVLAVALAIGVAGVLAGRDTVLAIQVAVALMIAAIPEGLPVVATIALARGMWRMARRNALIVRLSAVETLGATGVIITDKTGTLTENRMTVTHLLLPDQVVEVSGTGLETVGRFSIAGRPATAPVLERIDALLRTAVLCNNAALDLQGPDASRGVGDPTEIALLVAAAKRGLLQAPLLAAQPELREVAFSPETKAMATFNRVGAGLHVSVKGAPEAVLPHCVSQRGADGDLPLTPAQRADFLARVDALARQGLRTLALAVRPAASATEDPYASLVLLGAVALEDPPRPDVAGAISRCRAAGIRVVMVTGDHPATARNIAQEIGLDEPGPGRACIDARQLPDGALGPALLRVDARVIARATPQQKLDLIRHYQHGGKVVAMTGDGVNDAPALKQADIGVAMGIRGTPVAREAAAMVLQDDRFSTIVEAVAQGRAIYANIRKFVVYLLSCNLSEVLVVGLATVAGAPLPLLPLQILFLNLVTDVFPALALGVGEGPPGLMNRAPRPANEPVLARRHWAQVVAHGAVMCASVLGAMGIAVLGLGLETSRAVSVSFCTLALAQLWHVFNMRDRESSPFRNEITGNPWIWAAIALCLVLVLAAVYTPGVNAVLGLSDPGAAGWGLILLMSLLPLLAGPLVRAVLDRPGRAA